MGIGVYSIYLGSTWTSSGNVERLVRGFDAIPEFLYRLDRLPEDLVAETPLDMEQRRALMRIAMTQSHAMLLLVGPAASDAGVDTVIEVELARNAFRCRLPVIEINSAHVGGICDTTHPGADIAVGWDAASIACAVQQMSEQARADWRAHNRSSLALPIVTHIQRPNRPAASPQLPIAEITRAYETMRDRRADRFGPQAPSAPFRTK